MNTLKSASMQTRRAELAADVAATEQDLRAARQALIDGTAKARDVTSLQSTLHALQGALKDLDAQIEHQLEAEAQAQAKVERDQVVSQLADIARQGEQSAAEYFKALTEGCQAIQEAASRLISAHYRHNALRDQFRGISAGLLTNSHRGDLSWEDDETRARKVDERQQLRADLEAAGVDLSGIGVNIRHHPMWCDVPFSMPEAGPFRQVLDDAVRMAVMEQETAKAREKEAQWRASLADPEPLEDDSDTGDPETPENATEEAETDAEGQISDTETPTHELVEA